MGPLAGYRVVELGGSARPVCRHAAGGHGRRRAADRPSRGGRASPLRRRRRRCVHRSRRSVALDLKQPAALDVLLALVDRADALLEGFRPGVCRAAGLRPRGVPGAQPAAGVRAHDRLGPGRAAGRRGRPRHQLHCPGGRAARVWPRRRCAGAAAQPGGRLRRRRHAAGVRGCVRPARGEPLRARPGGRRGHGGRRARC